MFTIKLSYNQTKKAVWNQLEVIVKRGDETFYIKTDANGKLFARSWLGHEFSDREVTFKSDYFEIFSYAY